MRNIFSITIICLSFLILGVFLSLSNNLQYTAQRLSKDTAAVLYLEKNASHEERVRIEERVKMSPLATDIKFVSSNDALERFKERFPELRGIIDNLRVNPFLPSFEISIEKDAPPEQVQSFLRDIRTLRGVEDVRFNREWVEKMRSVSRLVQAVGAFLGGILILASFFIISNVIKLNVFARKEEIEILRLVGATNTFIRIPFLLEGIVLGILGGLLSLFLLLLMVKAFPFYLGGSLGVLQEIVAFRYLTIPQSLFLIAGGAFIGCLGSLSSLARFLKV
ncbi:MAG: cell division protein FtsX [Candidatus Aminicenantales bacterium]